MSLDQLSPMSLDYPPRLPMVSTSGGGRFEPLNALDHPKGKSSRLFPFAFFRVFSGRNSKP
jgi:hypothetical protein